MRQSFYKGIIGLFSMAVVIVVLTRHGTADPNLKRKKMDTHQLKKTLTKLQYDVTQCNATEPPFDNTYWDNKREGIYVDIVSGEPLFSSLDKYDSGTGWPSFTKPLESSNIKLRSEPSIFDTRTEVRSNNADSHLGHVFDDGPEPNGKRYCINSAALRFIPVSEMKKAGYGQYLTLFAKSASSRSLQTAIFAGGCFWCMESPFETLDGVTEVTSGYMGGHTKNPTYDQVSSGTTGHAEVVRVLFDSRVISYRELLAVFWRNIDPTTENRQFKDVGDQYRTAIFYTNEEQRKQAEQSIRALARSGRFDKKIVTEVTKATAFYEAEQYHQDYHRKNPLRYKSYRYHSGRDQYLDQIWGSEAESTRKK